MASLVPYPKAVPAYELGGDQYSGESVLEFIDTFRTDKNTFIPNNDKLHKWAMWRSRVNGSFIRNLPVSQDLPIDETTVREKRINIDRFLVHSDTDELKRLQMKDVYGHANGNQSPLGHSTYFLYGIPRISTGKDIIEGKQVNRRKGPHLFVDEESVRSRTPTPPPLRKQHFFVGSSQGANSVISDDHGVTLELSHALKSTSVFAKNQQEHFPENTKQLEPPRSEVPIQHNEPHQFDSRLYEARHMVPQIVVPQTVVPQYAVPQINVPQYQEPRYEIWREMRLIRDSQYELECQEGCVDFEEDKTSSISGYFST